MKKTTQIVVLSTASILAAGICTASAAGGAAAPTSFVHTCQQGRTAAGRVVDPAVRCKPGETRVIRDQRGTAAAPGQEAPGDLYYHPEGLGADVDNKGTPAEVGAIELPPGLYQLHAEVQMNRTGWMGCYWDEGQGTINTDLAATWPAGIDVVSVVSPALLPNGGRVSVSCVASQGKEASKAAAAISATRASSIIITDPGSRPRTNRDFRRP